MKTTQILKSILVASVLMSGLQSCEKDEPQQQAAEPLVLDCNELVASGASLNLEDRGSGVDYIIDCKAIVNGDLSIDPGVTIQFGGSGSLNVNSGSLSAVGTAEKPILFTGEDKIPGSWGYVVIKSDDVKNEMTYCTVEYAGAFQVSSAGDKGNVIIQGSARMMMDNCSVRFGEDNGVKITSNEVRLSSFSNNTITSCNYPLVIPSNLVRDISGGSYSGNTNDVVLVKINGFGNHLLTGSGETHVWNKLDVPYEIAKDLIVSGGTLEISAGTTIQFQNGIGIEIGDNDASTFIANGTSSEPILFTGVTKVAGSWKNILFNFTQSPLNRISHATIEYAGSENGAIAMWSDPVLSVENVDFKNNSSCAFYSNVPDFNPAAQVVNPNLSWSDLTFDNIQNENSETDQPAFPGGNFSYCH